MDIQSFVFCSVNKLEIYCYLLKKWLKYLQSTFVNHCLKSQIGYTVMELLIVDQNGNGWTDKQTDECPNE